MKKFAKNKGFTLLELLVVISIIGILIVIGSVAFSTAQRKGRDARRRGDLKAAQDGFEQYYATNDSEYATCESMYVSPNFPGGALVDPKGGSYSCSGDPDSYCICAELETGGGNAINNACSFGAGNFYCLTNLQ